MQVNTEISKMGKTTSKYYNWRMVKLLVVIEISKMGKNTSNFWSFENG